LEEGRQSDQSGDLDGDEAETFEGFHGVGGREASASALLSGKELFQFPDFSRGERLTFDKVGEHGFQGTAEDSVDERIAGIGNAVLFVDQWAVAEDAPFNFNGECTLFDESPEEGAGGLGMPGGILGNEADADLGGGGRMTGPHGAHDLPFGLGDSGDRMAHGQGGIWTTDVS